MSPRPVPVGAGRYAPSPSGALHLGNLRTAVLAWLFARTSGRRFVMRIEDVDAARVRAGAAEQQLADLSRLGLDWDDLLHQHERGHAYGEAIAQLPVYPCYCTRRDIQQAASAPHGVPGAYPGTCRDPERREAQRLRNVARDSGPGTNGLGPAIRLRSDVSEWTVHDLYAGQYSGPVDDFVLRRGDGVWAYNLAVVVDDGFQGVDQVVRGDDLLPSAPRQAYLAHLLGLPQPEYVHVPLALNREGKRLAKRDGAVTMGRIGDVGEVLRMIADSLGMRGATTVEQMRERFDPERLPREPWIVVPAS